MEDFRFKKWKVYVDAKELFNIIFINYKQFPYDVKNTIGQQIVRSSLSIILNIAEGCGKSSDSEMNRFFNISMGSVYETVANLDILHDNKLVSSLSYQKLYKILLSIKKQLGGFKKKLK